MMLRGSTMLQHHQQVPSPACSRPVRALPPSISSGRPSALCHHQRRAARPTVAAAAAGAGGDRSSSSNEDDASRASPSAAPPSAAPQAAAASPELEPLSGELEVLVVDDLTEDDNIILLLGSEDEEEDEDADEEGSAAGGPRVSPDFAAAMAAAREQLLSSSSSSSDEEGDGRDDWDTPYSEDFWSTEKERVFLVGATYKQQYQQQQQQQQQQQRRARSNSSSSSRSGARPRGLFDLSGSGSSGSSSSSNMRGSDGDGFSPAAAAAVAAAGELAAGGSGGNSSSSSGQRRRQRGGCVSYNVEESLEELGRLAETAGLQVVGSTYQVLESPNPATYIGSGKVAEVAAAVQAAKADTVVFDDELSPGQLRNLEKAFSGGPQGGRQVAVADRTALILDIFSQRARTREGRLQVDLAQTEYQLPRLTRMWTHLDRVAGGGQVKGAGEKQIEIDKRLLRDKAAALRRELEAVRTHRAAHRTRRQDAPIPVAALVGYTNAGKSTLLNTLTAAGVLAEDKLFATLDPTTRKVRLSGNLEVLFSDTVGFIQKLPTQLVAAFRATLEEIAAASVVVHVLDVSAPNAAAQCSAVLQVLDELGVQDLPMITAWNKIDACPNLDAVRALAASRPDVVTVSGATGEGLTELLELVALKLAEHMVDVEVLLPYSQGALLDEVHKMGKVTDTAYTESGTLVTANVPRCLVGKLQPYATDASSSLWSDEDEEEEEGSDDGLELVQLVDDASGSWQQQQELDQGGLVLSGRGKSSSNSSSSSSSSSMSSV